MDLKDKTEEGADCNRLLKGAGQLAAYYTHRNGHSGCEFWGFGGVYFEDSGRVGCFDEKQGYCLPTFRRNAGNQ